MPKKKPKTELEAFVDELAQGGIQGGDGTESPALVREVANLSRVALEDGPTPERPLKQDRPISPKSLKYIVFLIALVLLTWPGVGFVAWSSASAENTRLKKEKDELLARLKEQREALGLDRYIAFATHSPEYPSLDPVKARPVVIVGRDVMVKGVADPGIIQTIRFRFDPGPDADQRPLEKVVTLQGDPGRPTPFAWQSPAPTDSRRRVVTVTLVPRDEALKAAPEDLRPEKLTYRVNVDCLPQGPVAYVADRLLELQLPRAIPVKGREDYRVAGLARRDGFVLVLVKPAGIDTWYVQNKGRPYAVAANKPFSVPCDLAAHATEFKIGAILLPSEQSWKDAGEKHEMDGGFPTIKGQLEEVPPTEVQVTK